MKKFTLQFDSKNEMFIGEFKKTPREFIKFLKEKGFLEKVTPLFIEELPETFDGGINIDPDANTEDAYRLFFYLEVKATKTMKISIQEYLSRDIEINDEDDELEFDILVPKKSKFIETANKKEIVFDFSNE